MLSALAPIIPLVPIFLGIAAEGWRWWRHDPDRALRRLTRQHRRRSH